MAAVQATMGLFRRYICAVCTRRDGLDDPLIHAVPYRGTVPVHRRILGGSLDLFSAAHQRMAMPALPRVLRWELVDRGAE
jgi:hypothetical protein